MHYSKLWSVLYCIAVDDISCSKPVRTSVFRCALCFPPTHIPVLISIENNAETEHYADDVRRESCGRIDGLNHTGWQSLHYSMRGKAVCLRIITVLSGTMMLFSRNSSEVQISGLVTFLLLFIYIPNMVMMKRLLQPALPQKHCLFIEVMLSFRQNPLAVMQLLHRVLMNKSSLRDIHSSGAEMNRKGFFCFG